MRTRALGTGTFGGQGRGVVGATNAIASVVGSTITWKQWFTFSDATHSYPGFGTGYFAPRRGRP